MKFLRKILQYKFKGIIKEFCERSGLHGAKYIVNESLHPFERLSWLIIVLAALIGAIGISYTQYRRFQDSPIVVALERDYRTWSGTLPGATLCYYDHVDSSLAEKFIQQTWNIGLSDDQYFYFMEFLSAVLNTTIENYSEIANFAEDERFENIDLLEIATAVVKPFDQPIITYDSNAIVEIHKVITEMGMCFTFNSPISGILSGRNISADIKNKPLSCQYGKQQCFLRMEIAENIAAVSVHSPFEVYTYDAEHIDVEKSDELTIQYKVMETVGRDVLRDLHPQQRKCVFNDENTAGLPVYSTTLCLMKCRANMALEMCKCIPFFYPFVDGPRCNPAGFECLVDFKWPIWTVQVCNCPKTCHEIKYDVENLMKRQRKLNAENSIRPKAMFRWEIIPPKVRTRRNLIFSFEDFLVSFGGAISLFLGFSILSIADVGYLVYKYFMNTLANYIRRK